MDKINQMVGLDEVKSQVSNIKNRIESDQRREIDLKTECFSLVLMGNPGTGKSSSIR
jgi:DNA replication protein DnaC